MSVGLGGDDNPNQVDKLEDKDQQPRDEQQIVSWVKGKVEEVRNHATRIAFESEAITNTAYLIGYDNVYFDARAKQLRSFNRAGKAPRRGRIHSNLIMPTVNNRLARLCKNPPRYDVRPNSNRQEDKDAARLSKKVIDSTMERERANEKRIDLTMWMQQAGHSYVKVYWDHTKGRELPDYDESDELSGIEYEGDIALDICSPLEIFADPLAKTIDDAQWVIQAKVRKLSYFRTHYPERGELVKEEGAWLQSIQNILRINSMSNRGTDGTQDQMKNAAIEVAYYEKPSRKYPSGRQIIVANGVLLEYKNLSCGHIPFVKFDDIKIGGKYYSQSVITAMRPLQDQYNRMMRRKAEFLNKGLNLKFIAPKGHGLTQESINDSTEVIEYNPVEDGSQPKPVQAPQLPQYAYTDGETLKQDLNQISGINEASQGQMPSASIPAIGMQMLVEQDETRIGVITESNENSWAKVGELILRYAAKYYKAPRLIKEAGEAGEYLVQEFTSEDLKDHFDVIVIRGSTLPGSKVLKRQEIINLHQMGYLGNPQDPAVLAKVLQQLEYGDIAEVWEDQSVDMQQIKRSLQDIEGGMIPDIHDDDNHRMHFEYKNRLRKTEKFLNYPPKIKQLFLADLLTHKQLMLQSMGAPDMTEAGMGGPAGGAPPPMGEDLPPEAIPPEMSGLEGEIL